MNTQSDMKARVNTSEESEILENVSETAFRPRHSNPNSFSIQEEGALSEDSPNILETSFRGHQLKVFKRRWYILSVFSLMAFMQGGLINTWSVITPSAEAAFHWSDKDVSVMQVWVYISYLVAMLPFAVAIDKLGLRLPMIVNCVLMLLGCAMRCLITYTTHNLWLATVSHFLIGAAGVMAFTSGPIISALWFPANQRGTATAVTTIAGYTGGAVCFLFGPLLVESPSLIPINNSSVPFQNVTNIDVMTKQIMFCRYIELAIVAALTLSFIVYFPSKPSISPTITTAMGKLDLISGCRRLFSIELGHFWLVCFAYATAVSVYGVWNSLLGVNLKSLMSESDIGWLGFASVMAGSVMGVIIGRLSDLFVGKMKTFSLIMITCFIVSTFWFILLAHQYITFNPWQLMMAGIVQGLFNNGCVPLYYELAIEATYPVAELSVTAMMTLVYNIVPLAFLVVFLFPDVGTVWMDWVLLGAGIITFPILLLFKEQYRRSIIDKNCDALEDSAAGDSSLIGRSTATYKTAPIGGAGSAGGDLRGDDEDDYDGDDDGYDDGNEQKSLIAPRRVV